MESTPTTSTTPQPPLPHQPPTPQPPAKPSSVKKPRQRKQADTKQKSTPAAVPAAPSPRPTSAQDSPRTAPRGPPIQPYPGPPAYHVMHPPYPMNGSPFTQQPPYPPPAPPNGASGPGIPGQPSQYPYHPMHPAQYPPPPHYGAYPQYHQQMMMYAPPRPSAAPDTPQSGAPSPIPTAASVSGKRKRKSVAGGKSSADRASDDEAGASGSDLGRTQQQPSAASVADMKKRTKTQRACDSCRSRKIRCDILPDADPPACQHCKQYGFECTFFLPITETRFKKKKMEEEQANANPDKERSVNIRRATSSPHGDAMSKGDVRVFGPTSTAHLLHSQASVNSRIYESYDMRHHHTWEVSKNGEGLIQVAKPPIDEQHLAMPKPVDLHIERDMIQQLVNAYFTDVAPILPVVTQAEFLANPSPPPILLYAMCLVAAARREVPQSVFDSIRYAVNSVIKAEDVLSTASIVNVQALLILCMMGDCHSQFVPNALSALWIRLGTAIRMAQDLGLHRAESVKQNIELRRRLWGACVISDRWTSLTYGHPYMIDVQDCDARLPSSGDPNDLYMDELVRLSIILGRVLKTIYTPSGLTLTTDDMLASLLSDLESWKENLPESLRFHGADTSRNAGLLHLLYSCVCMLFWRVFMRISYTCPAHLNFALTVENWSSLDTLTGEAIDWLDAHERMYDVWLLVAYAATSCALVQYHSFARRKDANAAAKLQKLRDCVRKWEGSISPDHMSARRKTAEIIALLYEATQGPPLPIEQPALNPTGGVQGKAPLNGLTYKKDPSRPGGGVFIAHGEAREKIENYQGIPSGVIIHSSDEESEGEASATAMSSSVRASNDRGLLSSSSFAPPLPASDASSPTLHRGMMTSLASPLSSGGTQQQQQRSLGAGATTDNTGSSMVNITPLGSNFSNVNPAMNNATPGSVQVMNVLDVPQASGMLEQFAMADNGFLEGIPGGMFDWGQWDTFFARFNAYAAENGTAGGMAGFQQAQAQAQAQAHAQRRQSQDNTGSPRPQGSPAQSAAQQFQQYSTTSNGS